MIMPVNLIFFKCAIDYNIASFSCSIIFYCRLAFRPSFFLFLHKPNFSLSLIIPCPFAYPLLTNDPSVRFMILNKKAADSCRLPSQYDLSDLLQFIHLPVTKLLRLAGYAIHDFQYGIPR